MFAATSSHRLLLLFLLLVLALFRRPCDTYSPVPPLDLKGRSYQMDLRVSVDLAQSKTIYEIAEFHSARQKRSKVSYTVHGLDEQPLSLENSRTLYASEQEHLLIGSKRASCVNLERNWFDGLISGNVLAGFESGHLIGAARLLLFVEQNFAQFTVTPDTSGRPPNLLVYSASFGARGQDTRPFELQLFYHVEAIQNLSYGIPRHIVIKTSAGRIDYDIRRLKDLWDDRLQVDSSDASASTLNQGSLGASIDEIVFDMFALDRAIGCSQYFRNKDPEPKLRVTDEFRFSFNARPPVESGLGQLDISVAYEPHLGVLRVDHRGETRISSTLTDYMHSRRFNIVRNIPQADPDVDADQTGEISCVATRARLDEDPALYLWNPFSLGSMLLGTESMFYLGLAYVRGIEARVFEWDGCQRPVWLQQPAVYHTYNSTKDEDPHKASPYSQHLRDEDHHIRGRGFFQTNVLYFSNDAEDFELLDSKLLLVEVFTRVERTGAVMSRELYPIYDFAWMMPSSSPAGERYEDLFSLGDECLAELDENDEYGVISVSLEAKLAANESTRLNWLPERTKRNIALVNMAENSLFLMSTMIFDVESRLLVNAAAAADSPTSSDQTEQQLVTYRVDATMRAAQRTERLAELVLVGRGFLKSPNVELYMEFSFEMCHMMAAHLRVDTIFAYEAPESNCYLIKPDLGRKIDSLLKDIFKLNDRGIAEVYMIKHMEVRMPWQNNLQRLITSQICAKLSAVSMFDPTPADVKRTDLSARVLFKFTAFNIDTMNDEIGFDLNDLHWNGYNKFLGFGLDSSSGQNKQVEPKWTSDPDTKNYYQETMSFEHCQTACLADPECNSYSVCTRNGRISCVTSRISFDSPSMVVQLMEVVEEKRLKFGERFKVKLDSSEQSYISGIGPSEQFIEVVRHPGCELHNKIFRDLFRKTSQSTHMHVSSVSEPVAHLERCAKLCYQTTLALLRSPARQPMAKDEICDHFYYIDHKNLVAKDPKIAETILQHFPEHKSSIGGYCFIVGMKKSPRKKRNEKSPSPEAWLEMARYEFDFSSLYAKQAGVYLAQSKKTLDEELAKTQVGVKDGLTHPLVVREHENFGSIQIVDDPQLCAKICFTSNLLVFPVCRSFDFFEVENAKVKRFCSLNSVTLKSTLEAQRFDLIKYGDEPCKLNEIRPGAKFKVTHYEPRDRLVAHSLDEHYRIELERERQAIEAITSGSKRLHFGGFGLFCMVMFTLISGLVLGVVVGSKLVASFGKDPEAGESLVNDSCIVPETPAIQFSNLVNSDGQIVDRTQADGT